MVSRNVVPTFATSTTAPVTVPMEDDRHHTANDGEQTSAIGPGVCGEWCRVSLSRRPVALGGGSCTPVGG
jgi:hypothetical protein